MPDTDKVRKALEHRWGIANATIQDAYWRFTRCKGGKPPVLVVPEAYKERTRCERELAQPRGVGHG